MIEYGVLTGTPNAQLSRCGRVGDGAATWYASPADIPAGGGDADGGAAAGGGDDLSKTGVDGVVPATALGTLSPADRCADGGRGPAPTGFGCTLRVMTSMTRSRIPSTT